MSTATINVYRHGATWCYAAWVDGEHDSSDSLGVPSSATPAEAETAARDTYAEHQIEAVRFDDDID